MALVGGLVDRGVNELIPAVTVPLPVCLIAVSPLSHSFDRSLGSRLVASVIRVAALDLGAVHNVAPGGGSAIGGGPSSSGVISTLKPV